MNLIKNVLYLEELGMHEELFHLKWWFLGMEFWHVCVSLEYYGIITPLFTCLFLISRLGPHSNFRFWYDHLNSPQITLILCFFFPCLYHFTREGGMKLQVMSVHLHLQQFQQMGKVVNHGCHGFWSNPNLYYIPPVSGISDSSDKQRLCINNIWVINKRWRIGFEFLIFNVGKSFPHNLKDTFNVH